MTTTTPLHDSLHKKCEDVTDALPCIVIERYYHGQPVICGYAAQHLTHTVCETHKEGHPVCCYHYHEHLAQSGIN